MAIKVPKILLDSQLAEGMIGGVRIAQAGLAWNVKGTSATATSQAKRSVAHYDDDGGLPRRPPRAGKVAATACGGTSAV